MKKLPVVYWESLTICYDIKCCFYGGNEVILDDKRRKETMDIKIYDRT